MTVVLYWMSISHPSQVARRMLDLKGIEYRVVNVLPMNQRIHMRLAGFPGGTVPGLKLDGERIQGSIRIARELDERWPEPALYPADPAQRARVEEAEAWGEERLQPLPRRIFRYGAARHTKLRHDVMRGQGIPFPALVGELARPAIELYAHMADSDGRRPEAAAVRADLTALPGLLEHADSLLADGTLTTDPPNAATLQILSTVRVLGQFADLAELVASYRCAAPAAELFPRYRAALPAFLPAEWLEPVRAATAARA